MNSARAFIGNLRGLVWNAEDLVIAVVLITLMSLPWVRLVVLAASR
jgi:hypothetical protein